MKSVMEKMGECYIVNTSLCYPDVYTLFIYIFIFFIFFNIVDYAMSPDTVIVGDGNCQFLHSNGSLTNIAIMEEHVCAAVALVFTVDRNKPPGNFKYKLL